MKRALILTLTAILASPLLADETKKAEEKKKSETTTTAAATAPAPVASTDSPMVQAAKRANRLGRKSTSIVITNESLKGSKGHITTTTSQHPVNVPAPKPTAEEKAVAAKAKAAEQARVREIGEKEKAAAAERKAEEAAVRAEEDDGDAENIDYSAGQKPPLD